AGKRIPYTDSNTGKIHYAEIFVGVLGYSQLIFAKAIPSQKLEDWIEVHQDMLHYYGGVPQIVVPDNLKSAVTKAGRYPEVNRSYNELSQHYGFVIEPARVRKPQDKSLAEIGVLLVTRWITVILRRQKFFSVAEINKALEDLLDALNLRPFKRYEGNRRSRFEQGEQSALAPLPTTRFIFGRWMPMQKVPSNYHVYVLGHEYSVPFRYVSDSVQARVTAKTVEIYHESQPIALHVRSHEQGGATTDNYHRPAKHQHYAAQSKDFFLDWAKRLGSDVMSLVEAQFSGKQKKAVRAINACNKLQKLAKQYDQQRFIRACQCAVSIKALSATSVQSILQCHLDEQEDNHVDTQTPLLPTHVNVRGAEYYQGQEANL
ncbi:MAG: IS21 family transposase, partial [Psychrobium sp.]